MEVSQTSLALMLLLALACGGGLGVLYDGFHIVRGLLGIGTPPIRAASAWARRSWERAVLPPPLQWRSLAAVGAGHARAVAQKIVATTVFFLQDILFCLIGVAVLILLLYATNDGQFRLSALVVALLGLALYRITIGRLIRRLWANILILLHIILQWTTALVLFPLRCLWKRAKPPLSVLARRLRCRCTAILRRIKGSVRARLHARRRGGQTTPPSPTEPPRRTRPTPDGKHTFVSGRGNRPI